MTSNLPSPYAEARGRKRDLQRRRRGAAGFSLIELVVVIAIISIFAALVLTGLAAAKEKAKHAQCAHNVAQLGLGVQMFLTDNHVYPLTVNPDFSKGAYPEHQTAWATALQGVLARGDPVRPNSTNALGEGIWVCPAAPRPAGFPDSLVFVSYGYNGYGLSTRGASFGLGGQKVWLGGSTGSAPPVRDSEVANPSQVILLGDGFEGGKGVIRDGLTVLRRRNRTEDFVGSTARAVARHKHKANVAFCDSHVEVPTLKFLFEEDSDTALARWNRDNRPHRELLTP